MDKNKYLDFDGLKKYDELIKGYIAFGNKSFASASDVSSLKIDVDYLKGIVFIIPEIGSGHFFFQSSNFFFHFIQLEECGKIGKAKAYKKTINAKF